MLNTLSHEQFNLVDLSATHHPQILDIFTLSGLKIMKWSGESLQIDDFDKTSVGLKVGLTSIKVGLKVGVGSNGMTLGI